MVPEIPGWYGYSALHRKAVESAPPNSTLVEVGVFLGKSLVSLSKLASAANKGLKVIGVDTFQGSPEHFHPDGPVNLQGLPFGQLAFECMTYLNAHEVINDVTLIVTDSVKASKLFADGSLHMIFIDADHSEESVTQDIAAWLPKVASGGVIAGDDYHGFPGVKAAVDKSLSQFVVPGCWWESWR